MFATKRSLVNPKFEGYKLDAIDQERCAARYNLQYTLTQATVSTHSPLSFHEVQSRITHNHIAAAPDGARAVYVDAQYRVILVDLEPDTCNPSFRAVYELSQPIQSQNGNIHHEYPSAAFLSASEIFVSDGSGLLYILQDSGSSSSSFQLLGMYELHESTPFRIHNIVQASSGEALVILSSRKYGASLQKAIDFDVWAAKFCIPLASSSSGAVQPLDIVWQRRGHAVPIHVGYDESRRAFMLLGDCAYAQVDAPIAALYSPSADELAPIPRPNENLDAATPESLKPPPPYSWTQTSDSVTVVVPLPSTTPKADIKVTFSQQSLTLHIQSNIASEVPLPHYSAKRLWGGISTSSSMWTWDREGEHHVGLLTLHLDKQHEGTKWPHVFAASGTSPEEAEVLETLDPSELWNIREALEKYTAALRNGEDLSGLGLGSDLPSLAMGEMDDEVDNSIGRAAQLTWVGEDGSAPSESHDLPNRLLSTELPGSGSGTSLILKNGIDGNVYSLQSASSPEQPPEWVHTSTFSALSFVLASKTDTRFTYHIPSTAVFAFDNGLRNHGGNVYIYRAAPPSEKWAKQAVLRVGQEGSLLGVGAVKSGMETVLLCLTEQELIVITNLDIE
ncbi:hypothetical protein DFH06DRAFT_1317990 [Mycena polygramma]|nr:hypothetical protein DFH06DRAFT_1317990 [Mycena polygramma]